MSESIKLEILPEACTGCNACLYACSLEKFQVFSNRNVFLKIEKDERESLSYPLSCGNCEGNPCLDVCAFNAIKFDDSLNIPNIDSALCVGCRKCIQECPFGIIHFDEGKLKANKCDLCKGDPACVKVCIPGAIKIVSYEKIGE